MMKWDNVLSDKNACLKVQQFATGKLSRRDVERVSGMRSFVRQEGADRARGLAKKALRRRGVKV